MNVHIVAAVIEHELGNSPIEGRSVGQARPLFYYIMRNLYGYRMAEVARLVGHKYDTVKKMSRLVKIDPELLNQLESLLITMSPEQALDQQIDFARQKLNKLLLIREAIR